MSVSVLFRILMARLPLMIFIVLVSLTVITLITFLLPEKYRASVDLIIDSKGQDPISGYVMPAQQMRGHIQTQADVISSRTVLQRAAEILVNTDADLMQKMFNSFDAEGGNIQTWLAANLRESLSVVPHRESSILSILVDSSDARFAALAANAIAEAYIETNLELRVEPARRVSQWYDLQLTELRLKLEQAQADLSRYQEEHGIVSVDEKLDIETTHLMELNKSLWEVQNRKLDSQSRNNQMANSSNESLTAEVLSNPLIVSLKNDLTRAQTHLDEAATRVGINHPQYKEALQEVATLETRLAHTRELVGSSIVASTKSLEETEKQIADEMANQKSKVLTLNRKRNELALLEQEVKNAQNVYDATMTRATQAQLESQSSLTNIMVLTEASTPGRSYSPRKKVNIFVGAVFSVFLALTIALLLEWARRCVRHQDELEALIGIPVLACIPANHVRAAGFGNRLTRGGSL